MKTISLKKKVAAVAVASLGLGLLSVAPASSAITAFGASKTNASPAASISAPTTVGTAITSDLNVITTGNAQAAVTAVFTWKLLNPNGADVTSSATITAAPAAGITSANVGGTAAAPTQTVIVANGTNAGTYKVGTIVFTPAMAGRYTLQFARAESTGEVVAATANANATTPYWYVSGSGAVVAASGVGTTTIGAVSGGIAQIRFATAAKASGAVYNLTSSGVGSIQTVANGTTAPAAIAGIAAASDFSQGARITGSADTDHNDVLATVTSTVAGTQTLTWTAIDSTTGAPTVVASQAITWGAAPALSVANSKVFISAGDDNTTLNADDAAVYLASTAAATTVANIQVTLNNDAGTAFNGQKLVVTVEGPGLFGVDVNDLNGVTAGRTNRIYADSSANAGNTWQIGIAADGTAGTSKFTIKVGDVTVATKTLTFFGAVSKYTATPVLVATANGAATNDAVIVCAVDANGNPVPGATIYASSGVTAVASIAGSATTVSSAVVEDVDGAGNTTSIDPTAYVAAKAVGCAGFAVTAASQITASEVVMTFRNASTAAASTVTTTATVKVGGVAASSITLSSDKATYSAGEKIVLTLTFKDAQGRLVGAGPGTATLDAALTASAGLSGDALFAANNNSKLGIKTATVYAPLTAGALKITGETGVAGTYVATAAAGKALSLDLSVTSAIDAQIASLIAAIAKLQKAINKINKRLNR